MVSLTMQLNIFRPHEFSGRVSRGTDKMKNFGYFLLLLFAPGAHGFDFASIDEGVSRFLSRWNTTCEDIDYSFIYALRMDLAYESGFYSTHPSNAKPSASTDILVAVEADTCGEKDGYYITFRPGERYKVVDYASFLGRRLQQ